MISKVDPITADSNGNLKSTRLDLRGIEVKGCAQDFQFHRQQNDALLK